MARLLKDESGELKRLMKAVGLPEGNSLLQRYIETTLLSGEVGDIFKDPWLRP